jgi:NADP-dependent 3-hydroxy acid dehydrogenase YdfG
MLGALVSGASSGIGSVASQASGWQMVKQVQPA